MTTAAPVDLAAIKTRQQATWASGDYHEIAALIVPISENLADAADLKAGSSVLDVACGSGNASIAAARLGTAVTGIDYVPSLLARASWTPDGFIGQMFKVVGKHVPPPAGLSSPLLWGTEDHLSELFGSDVEW